MPTSAPLPSRTPRGRLMGAHPSLRTPVLGLVLNLIQCRGTFGIRAKCQYSGDASSTRSSDFGSNGGRLAVHVQSARADGNPSFGIRGPNGPRLSEIVYPRFGQQHAQPARAVEEEKEGCLSGPGRRRCFAGAQRKAPSLQPAWGGVTRPLPSGPSVASKNGGPSAGTGRVNCWRGAYSRSRSERFRLLPAQAGRLTPEAISRASAARSRRSRTVFRSEEKASTLARAERSVPEPKKRSGWRPAETSRWIRSRDGSGGIEIDQEYDPVTGKEIYRFTEEEARPEEAIRVLSETRAVLVERFEEVHRLPQA